jgi:hypothetical protein
MNLLSPDRVAQCMGLPTESPKSVERQVDLMFGLLTERLPADTEAATTAAAAPHTARAVRSRGPAAERDETVVYPWRTAPEAPAAPDAHVAALQAENAQLKQLVGTLALEKKILLDRLADAAP